MKHYSAKVNCKLEKKKDNQYTIYTLKLNRKIRKQLTTWNIHNLLLKE